MKQAKGILGKDVSGECLGHPDLLSQRAQPPNTPAASILCLDAEFRGTLSSFPGRRLGPGRMMGIQGNLADFLESCSSLLARV